MKKEDLIAQGLTEEQAKYVMAEHGKTVTTLNSQVATLQQSETDLKSQLSSRDKDLAKLQKDNKDNEELKTQIDTLKTQYKDLEKTSAENLTKIQRESALNTLLTESKVKNPKAVAALLDNDTIVFKDGQLSGAKEQIEALQKSDAYLFDLGTKQGAYNPTGGAATTVYKSFEEALQADDLETYFEQQEELGGNE